MFQFKAANFSIPNKLLITVIEAMCSFILAFVIFGFVHWLRQNTHRLEAVIFFFTKRLDEVLHSVEFLIMYLLIIH